LAALFYDGTAAQACREMTNYDAREQFRMSIRHKTPLFYDENSALNNQFALLRGRNNAAAFPAFARHGLVNPLALGCPAIFTIQSMVHAALVEVKSGLADEFFQFAAEPPPLDFVALAIFYEFF
jgi:hypothetical protein